MKTKIVKNGAFDLDHFDWTESRSLPLVPSARYLRAKNPGLTFLSDAWVAPPADNVLGYYVVAKTTRFTKDQSFAGAVDTVEVQPGRYPIELRRDQYGQHYVAASLPGVLVFSGWFGSNTRVSEPMTPDTYSWQPYAHRVAEMAATGDSRIELAEGVSVASVKSGEYTLWGWRQNNCALRRQHAEKRNAYRHH